MGARGTLGTELWARALRRRPEGIARAPAARGVSSRNRHEIELFDRSAAASIAAVQLPARRVYNELAVPGFG